MFLDHNETNNLGNEKHYSYLHLKKSSHLSTDCKSLSYSKTQEDMVCTQFGAQEKMSPLDSSEAKKKEMDRSCQLGKQCNFCRRPLHSIPGDSTKVCFLNPNILAQVRTIWASPIVRGKNIPVDRTHKLCCSVWRKILQGTHMDPSHQGNTFHQDKRCKLMSPHPRKFRPNTANIGQS